MGRGGQQRKIGGFLDINKIKIKRLFFKNVYDILLSYLPTPLLGQDMTQGQFLSGV